MSDALKVTEEIITYMGELAKALTDSAPLGITVRANAAKPFTLTADCDSSVYDWALPLMVTGEWVGK